MLGPMWRLPILLGFVLAVAACGYRPVLGQASGRLDVPVVVNRTAVAGLAGAVTAAVRREAVERGYEVVSGAGTRLLVEIVAVQAAPGALGLVDGRLAAASREVVLVLEARLERGGAVVAGPVTVDARALVAAPDNPLAGEVRIEQAAQTTLADEGARRLFDRLGAATGPTGGTP